MSANGCFCHCLPASMPDFGRLVQQSGDLSSPARSARRQWRVDNLSAENAMTDRFENSTASLSGPASHAFTITPSDTAALAETLRGVYIGGGGAITAITQSGATVEFTALPSGSILPVRLSKILATGTTATGLVGLV
jgi:hypothetical protein